jgi:hypothetical protein
MVIYKSFKMRFNLLLQWLYINHSKCGLFLKIMYILLNYVFITF